MCEVYDRAASRAVTYANNRDGKIGTAQKFLDRCGWKTFGVESISVGNASADFLNTGDTYETTVLEVDGRCLVSSWGDWYETAETEYCMDEEVIRCAYCSHFTPNDRDDWQDVVCESCNHNVGG